MTACADMEHRIVMHLEANSTAFLAHLQHLTHPTTRLNKQQSIPVTATRAAKGRGNMEAHVPSHDLLNDDTMRIVPNVVDIASLLRNDASPRY
jgi:hypothetical protein